MNIRPSYRLPEEKERLLGKAIRLEWITIGLMLTIIAVMYVTMGSSQAMKTAWVEDLLSLVPPISFLIAMRFRSREPNERFPYGYRRATMLAFLVASVAVLVLGLYLLIDASHSLISGHHPTLGHMNLFGLHVWSGWVMIVALIYSMIPPIILGRVKLPIAKEIHEKTLFADADMNKADWMTAVAGVLGIVGIGLGFWWADAVAAGFISIDVLRDGFGNVRRAFADLMDERPTRVENDEPLGLEGQILDAVRSSPDVVDAGVRLREEGHVISGELFVVLRKDGEPAAQLKRLSELASSVDWRVYNLVLMPVDSLE